MKLEYRYKWSALTGLSLLSFTAFLDYTIVATALPFIQKDLHASVLQLQWVTNIFMMVLCMFMIIVGQLGDNFGRKRVFFSGFIIFGIAALGAGYAETIQQLIFFRALQGFAGAIIFTLGVALIPQAFPEREYTKAVGIFSAFNGAGLALGPFLGGLIITYLSWRWVFWINIPIIIIGFLLCSYSLQATPKIQTRTRIDFIGLILLIVGLGGIVYGLIYGEQRGWQDALAIIFICVGIVALVLLFIFEQLISYPLLDLNIFSHPGIKLSLMICLVAGLITSVFMFFDPLFLELIRGQTAFMIGVTLLTVPIVQVIISLLLPYLIKHFGIYQLILFGFVTGFIAAICHLYFDPTISIYFICLGLMLMGYSWGIGNAGTIAAVNKSIPAERLGVGIGTVFTFWNISGSIFLALSSIIFHNRQQAKLMENLTAQNITITPHLREEISFLLSEPEKAQVLLHTVGHTDAQAILPAFVNSFLYAYHWVAGASAVVMGIILLFGLWFYREIKARG